MLYSFLYGNKNKTSNKTTNAKLLKMVIQTERVKNDVPHRRVPVLYPNLPCPLTLSQGDDLVLCEATKMVEDMIGNVTVYRTSIKTYPRKKIKIPQKFGSDSKIFQNIIQLSNIYSQKSNSSFENEEQFGLCINCPEVDPDAHKFNINFECGFGLSDPEDEDIFRFYEPFDIKNEPASEEIDVVPSEPISNVPNINLHEFVALDENLPNWYDIYRRIDNEILSEDLNNDSFLNVNGVNKKFYIKIGSALRLVSISIKDVPNNLSLQNQSEDIIQHKLFDEIDVTANSSKRRHESENEEQTSSNKQLKVDQTIRKECSTVNEKCDNWNNLDLLDEDDTFINAIKLEVALSSPKEDPVSIKIEYENELPENCEPIELPTAEIEQLTVANSVGNTHIQFNTNSFEGFQTGHGKPIDLPKNEILKKYLQLYENIDVTDDDLLSTKE